MNYILNENSISFVVNSTPFSIPRTDDKFHSAIGIIFDPVFNEQQKYENLQKLIDDKFYVLSYLNLCPVIASGKSYGSVKFSNIRRFIPNLSEHSIPHEIFVNLLNNLSCVENGSDILTFIFNNKILISNDGNLYIYKGIREDYTDCFSGTVLNKVGLTNEMPREQVTIYHGGPGFYFGTYSRAVSMSRGHIVICKIDIKDIVWVDENEMKVCKYKIIKEETKELPFGTYDFAEVVPEEPSPVPEPKKPFKALAGLRRMGLWRRKKA